MLIYLCRPQHEEGPCLHSKILRPETAIFKLQCVHTSIFLERECNPPLASFSCMSPLSFTPPKAGHVLFHRPRQLFEMRTAAPRQNLSGAWDELQDVCITLATFQYDFLLFAGISVENGCVRLSVLEMAIQVNGTLPILSACSIFAMLTQACKVKRLDQGRAAVDLADGDSILPSWKAPIARHAGFGLTTCTRKTCCAAPVHAEDAIVNCKGRQVLVTSSGDQVQYGRQPLRTDIQGRTRCREWLGLRSPATRFG
jgi:hypothetical protein